jgi:hypothetical protein
VVTTFGGSGRLALSRAMEASRRATSDATGRQAEAEQAQLRWDSGPVSCTVRAESGVKK